MIEKEGEKKRENTFSIFGWTEAEDIFEIGNLASKQVKITLIFKVKIPLRHRKWVQDKWERITWESGKYISTYIYRQQARCRRSNTELQIWRIKINSIDTACFISSPIPIIDHLLESSRRDDSNKWSNIGIGEEKGILEIKNKLLIWIHEQWQYNRSVGYRSLL